MFKLLKISIITFIIKQMMTQIKKRDGEGGYDTNEGWEATSCRSLWATWELPLPMVPSPQLPQVGVAIRGPGPAFSHSRWRSILPTQEASAERVGAVPDWTQTTVLTSGLWVALDHHARSGMLHMQRL